MSRQPQALGGASRTRRLGHRRLFDDDRRAKLAGAEARPIREEPVEER